MIPIVNDKYRYILLYSAKVACTSLRKLYLELHMDELSDEQRNHLRAYHNVNEVQRYDLDKDYSGYTTFAITRNPYARIISAFLDQFVYAQNSGVRKMLSESPPDKMPNNFLEFLQYLANVPDKDRDSHFRTQSFLPFTLTVVTRRCLRYWIPRKPESQPFKVNYDGDISGYKKHFAWLYKRVFKKDPAKYQQAMTALTAQNKSNSLFYSEQEYANAALLSLSELDNMVFAPKPQDFLQHPEVVSLVQSIYAEDFRIFGYKKNDFPNKGGSKENELLPNDFDWQMYKRLNPDLGCETIRNERSYIRHYLEYGRFEGPNRAFKLEAPEGFEWQRYLNLHADLPAAGINTEEGAIEHYLSFGLAEGRAI